MGKFQVAIMHGHSKDYLEVKKINGCDFLPGILVEEYAADTIFENLRDLIWDDVHCVIVILTKDDEMLDGNERPRQNVIINSRNTSTSPGKTKLHRPNLLPVPASFFSSRRNTTISPAQSISA